MESNEFFLVISSKSKFSCFQYIYKSWLELWINPVHKFYYSVKCSTNLPKSTRKCVFFFKNAVSLDFLLFLNIFNRWNFYVVAKPMARNAFHLSRVDCLVSYSRVRENACHSKWMPVKFYRIKNGEQCCAFHRVFYFSEFPSETQQRSAMISMHSTA